MALAALGLKAGCADEPTRGEVLLALGGHPGPAAGEMGLPKETFAHRTVAEKGCALPEGVVGP